MKIRYTLTLAAALVIVIPVGCAPVGGDETAPGRSESSTPAADTAPAAATQEGPLRNEALVIFGTDTVRAEIARTPAERAQGLMERDTLPPGRGMLFVFEDQGIRSFWMGNTYIALDIAFIDANLRIVDIQAMEPLTTNSHTSRFPAMFALEVPQGWFEENGVGVGSEAKIVF
ncbi:MAG: DUF192 domain-containing protein [Gemmatimonadetes bacterium]|nr:DUF192 domain-containing protein [Gemmatimonadota bacterium]